MNKFKNYYYSFNEDLSKYSEKSSEIDDVIFYDTRYIIKAEVVGTSYSKSQAYYSFKVFNKDLEPDNIKLGNCVCSYFKNQQHYSANQISLFYYKKNKKIKPYVYPNEIIFDKLDYKSPSFLVFVSDNLGNEREVLISGDILKLIELLINLNSSLNWTDFEIKENIKYLIKYHNEDDNMGKQEINVNNFLKEHIEKPYNKFIADLLK